MPGWDWGEDGRWSGCRLPPTPSLFPISSASFHSPLPSITVAVTFTLLLFSGTAATFCHVIPSRAPALATPRQARAAPRSPSLVTAPQPPPPPQP